MRGFSVPLVIIVALFVGGFALYSYSATSPEHVKGVATVSEHQTTPGFSVSIISKAPAWDLMEYLCVTQKECMTSLSSGKRLSTVSGGATELKEVQVNYSDGWGKYSHIKLFVRPSWLISNGSFRVVTPGDIPGTEIEKMPVGKGFQDVLLIPLKEISSTFYKSAAFSDR
jgi:hypothetical protein